VKYSVECDLGSAKLTLSTGVMARQANGAAVVRYVDTVVLAAAVAGSPRDVPFLPLTVDYREKQYAAGRIPGGFFKREGRPTTKETLTMRLIDRPIRALFPGGFTNELQIQAIVLSADQENDPDVLAVNAASAALAVSDIPFEETVGCVRVGLLDGEFVLNPTHTQLKNSELDLIVAATKERVIMVEASANEVPEDRMAEAVLFGQRFAREIALMITDLAARCGKPKFEPEMRVVPEGLIEIVRQRYGRELETRCFVSPKAERDEGVSELQQRAVEELTAEESLPCGPVSEEDVSEALHELERQICRRGLLEGRRVDGRGMAEVRPISCEVGVLPRTHGSALFTRGETQALVVATLGSSYDEQRITGLVEEYTERFMLHYNFPPFCVGEIRPIRGPGRREIGHGALAERSLRAVMPSQEDFPYTIRVVSDVLESNGSSSMATVCGATLCLMDAGVPISDPVAGVAMGLVDDESKQVILTDILGAEDHFGDMDFKIAGTQNGITGLQLDVKAGGLNEELLRRVLAQAKEGRLHILRAMLTTLPQPRETTSEHAPKNILLRINPEKIGLVIGPGGRTIRQIQEQTGSQIDIEDDGTLTIAAPTAEGAEAAEKAVRDLTAEIEVGQVYRGKVTSVRNFGAFVELLPGREGLLHISEISQDYIENIEDAISEGDEVEVKVIGLEEPDRIRLSRKALLSGDSDDGDQQRRPNRPSGGRDRRRSRRPR